MSLCWTTKENKKKIVIDDNEELYLAGKNFETLPDFSKYKFLKRLYLNNNKILHLNDGLQRNYTLSELYLQNNKLINITGCLQHLTCVQILLLQSNQLTNLTDVVHEIRCMRNLKILNLFNNPLAQEYDYRNYVVHHIESLELFDRKAVIPSERSRISHHYDENGEDFQQRIAFGTHVPQVKQKHQGFIDQSLNSTHYAESQEKRRESHTKEQIPEHSENSEEISVEDKIDVLTKKRMDEYSATKYRVFDWNHVLELREQRCSQNNTNENKAIVYNVNIK